MEVYILDSLLRREQVVDSFESLIWTERWSEIGDFELRLPSTLASRSTFITGIRLALNESHRVMMVETVEDATDEEGQSVLTVKGRSLEAIMEDRIVKSYLGGTENGGDQYSIGGTAPNIARSIFYSFVVQGALSSSDKYPFLSTYGSFLPPSTIPEPSEYVNYIQEMGTVYDFIKTICDTYELGFRIVRNFDKSELYFDIYTGNDLTTAQTVFRPIIFSPSLDNLQNTSELTSMANAKSVAYVFSETNFTFVYANGGVEDYTGFDRKVLMVKTSNPKLDGGAYPGIEAVMENLARVGREELAKHQFSSIFDGELNQNSDYKYGVDYNLGDKVEVRNADGVVSVRRVTEQIFVSDTEGDRSYPTLSESSYSVSDTWLYQGTDAWSDKRDDEYWSNQ